MKDDVSNEILTDTPITAEADKIVTLIANTAGYFKTVPYTYTITAATETTPSYATITGFNYTDNSLINNIDGYNYETGVLTFPSTITVEDSVYTVKEIGASAFLCDQLLAGTAIVLPEKLERINNYAFNYSPIVWYINDSKDSYIYWR